MTVPLAFRQFGKQEHPPIVILHGLLGSSRNWTSIAKALGSYFSVYAIDLRNHGRSPHDTKMSFEVMEKDLLAWIDNEGFKSITLLGHSMGGKVSMAMACHYPERVKRLIIVDIAPKIYTALFLPEMEAMAKMDLNTIKNRSEADHILAETVKDWPLRQFLLTNLERHSDGKFRWQVNLSVLIQSLLEIKANPLQTHEYWEGDTLFVKGEKSTFIQEEDKTLIHQHFPNSHMEILPESGHNPHIDNKNGFLETLSTFLHLKIEA